MNVRLRVMALTALIAIGLTASGCGPRSSGDADKDDGGKTSASTASESTELTDEALLEKVQAIVAKSSQNQFKASKTFDGPAGLVGVLIEAQAGGGAKQVAWTTSSGEVLIPGPAYNAEGVNLAEAALRDEAGYISAAQLANRIKEQDRGFLVGKSGPIVTVFFEPYCGYCGKLFQDMRPLIDKGEIRARFIMVGFLRPDSVTRAAELASAANPYRALGTWEDRKDKQAAPAAKADAADEEVVRANSALMGEAGQGGTPALVVCKKDGTVELINGMPGDLKAFLGNISDQGHALCGADDL